jgi:DNA-binding LacI/PurR family transcriptional regulator
MVLICNTGMEVDRELNYIKKLVGRKIDGIVYNAYTLSQRNIDTLKAMSENTPVVFMDHVFKRRDKISYVVTEGTESTCASVSYLRRQCRRRIAYNKIGPRITVLENRFKGYLKGLDNFGLEADKSLVYEPNPKTPAEMNHISLGAAAGAYFASMPNPPDAIIAAVDTLAIGCMKELKKRGVKIPDDMALVGFDNISLCELVEPALTTIAQPIDKIGAEAARIIIDKLEGVKSPDKIVFPGELVIRQSA